MEWNGTELGEQHELSLFLFISVIIGNRLFLHLSFFFVLLLTKLQLDS